MALHFIANLESMPGRMYDADFLIEYDQTENSLREELTSPSIKMTNGLIQVPTTAGLGIEVNEEALIKYSISKDLIPKFILD